MKNLAKYLVALLLLPSIALAQPSAPDKVKIWDSGGQNLDITAASAAKVDGSAVTQPVSAVSLPLPSGAATEATLSSLNGKVTAVNTGATVISSALPAGSNNIGDVDVLTVPADPFGANADAASATGSISAKLKFIASTGIPITGTVTVGSHAVTNAGTFAVQAGTVAHDAVDSGNPVKVGFKAYNANPTAVSSADRTDAISDLIGRQVTVPYSIPENTWTACLGSDITNTTSTQVKAATASIRHYITSVSISNMAASVATRVDILDGSTVIWQCPAAAAGGGCTQSFPVPLRGTANTAINAQPATTSSATRVCVSGYDAAN